MSTTSVVPRLFIEHQLNYLGRRKIESHSHKTSDYDIRFSSTGQQYAVLVLSGTVYNTVYLFIEDPWPHLGKSYKAALRRTALISKHATESGTADFVNRIHEMFEEPSLKRIRSVFPNYTLRRDRRFTYRKLDALWFRNYDEWLERGDIVLCRWKIPWGVYHAGIYIGNGQVIHRSGGGQMSKRLSIIQSGDLVQNFAGGPDKELWVMKFIVRIRSNEEIAATAEHVAENPDQYPELIKPYKLITNDCQKFVTYCALKDFFKWDPPFKTNSRF